ncbi:cation diffusion facilitator family transporter [Alteromonas flava]|uniref:cation diffusion facilitator family transporter n=1 Tax=Alteromonas flava TaxID=2048003 RepID=UPI000C28232E|nr:cation diffusion facilitator family transporter [Alteromonas flava]
MAIGFHEQREKHLLRISFLVACLFVGLAFIFAILTSSAAILFDGVYSLLACVMALLTLKVANLVQRPDDERFHFGYTAIEPTLNLFKAIFILAICAYAIFGAIASLLEGGNTTNYGIAMGYGGLATLGCFAVALYMKRKGRHLRSDLVVVDAQTWFIDGVLSASILLGFVLAFVLEQLSLSKYSPYVDPLLLMVLAVFMLPIPLRILKESLNEVINKAPPEAVSALIEKKLKKTLSDVPYEHVEVRISKCGRDVYLLVHIIVSDAFSIATIAELDAIRLRCEKEMCEWDPAILMDILFIKNPVLAD